MEKVLIEWFDAKFYQHKYKKNLVQTIQKNRLKKKKSQKLLHKKSTKLILSSKLLKKIKKKEEINSNKKQSKQKQRIKEDFHCQFRLIPIPHQKYILTLTMQIVMKVNNFFATLMQRLTIKSTRKVSYLKKVNLKTNRKFFQTLKMLNQHQGHKQI